MTSTSTSDGSGCQSCRSPDLRLLIVVLGAWLIVDGLLTEAATPSGNVSRPVMAFDFNTTDFEVLGKYMSNSSSSSSRNSTSDDGASRGRMFDELQLAKLIVLIVVVAILLLSTCTFILRTFSLFAKKDNH